MIQIQICLFLHLTTSQRRQNMLTRPVDHKFNKHHAQNVRDGAAQDAGNNFVWHYYDIEDPYEPDWLPVYDRRQSVLVDTSDFSPVDFFKLYFPDEAIELISNETNSYAEQFFDAPHDFDSHSRFHKWTDTTFEEISAMLAMKITTGICSMWEQDNSSTRQLIDTVFGENSPTHLKTTHRHFLKTIHRHIIMLKLYPSR